MHIICLLRVNVPLLCIMHYQRPSPLGWLLYNKLWAPFILLKTYTDQVHCVTDLECNWVLSPQCQCLPLPSICVDHWQSSRQSLIRWGWMADRASLEKGGGEADPSCNNRESRRWNECRCVRLEYTWAMTPWSEDSPSRVDEGCTASGRSAFHSRRNGDLLWHGSVRWKSPFTVWWLHKVRPLNTAGRRSRGAAPTRQPLRSNTLRGLINASAGWDAVAIDCDGADLTWWRPMLWGLQWRARVKPGWA